MKKFVFILMVFFMAVLLSACAPKNSDTDHPQDKNANSGQQGAVNATKDDGAFHWPSTTAKYITAVPVDLTQIQSISKYRSCAGHDRSGYTFGQVLETDRSMKHYLYPVPAYQGTEDKVKIFAPFDGTIIGLDWEKDKVSGRTHNGNGIHLSSPVDPNATLGIGHMYFVKEFTVGDTVTAGELLGYAALYEAGNDFDLDLSTPRGTSAYNGLEVLDSAFDHMTDAVLAEFATYGITPENTKLSKEYRDAHPCNYPNTGAAHQGRNNEDWVQLTH